MTANARGRVDTPIVTRDAVVPVGIPVRLGVVRVVTAPRDVEAGSTRRVVAMGMVEIVTGNGEVVVVDDGKVVEVARPVADEDVVVRTEIH